MSTYVILIKYMYMHLYASIMHLPNFDIIWK